LEALEDRTLPSSISGTVFNDLNGDGLQGADEPGLQNWVVDLFQGQTRIQQLLTGTNGNFSFNVDPGAYTVQEETQTSWLLTSTPATYKVDTSGGDVSGVVFGNFQTVRISGTVFDDLNGDGVQGSTEPGLQGWTVDLIRGQGVAKRQTDPSGNFTFAGVGPGSYTIQVELQSGFVQTSQPTTYSGTTSSGTDLSGKVFGVAVPEADLSVTKAGPASTIAGDPADLTYTITVINNGPSDAQSVVLSDMLPEGESFVSQSQLSGPAFTLSNLGNGISDTINMLAAQASASFTLVAHVAANISNGTVMHNQATIASITGDPDLSNNAFTVDTTVVSQADLAVIKTDPAETIAGDPANLTYTITVVNNGPSDAQAVALSDALPAGETLVSQTQTSGPAFALDSSDNTINDTLATLAAGASASFTVVAHVSPSVPEGTVLSNTATISSTTTDPDTTNNSSTASTLVHAQADLSVSKTGPDEAIAGDPANVTYTITVVNNGPSDAQAVALSDALPAGETLVSQTQTSGPAFALDSSNNTINDTLATLAAGASASFTVVAHVSPSVLEGTVLRNTATISTSTTDPDTTNNSSTADTVVHAQADLAVSKTGPDEAIAGDPANVTYTITVVNNGPSDAQAVALSDALPAGETLVSQTQTSGPAFALSSSDNTINDTLATLAAGASASFTVVAHVSPSVLEGTVLSNTATISSSTTDPDTTNNSSTADTLVHAATDTTTTIVTSSANPSVLAQPVTLTATVSSAVSSAATPTGDVDFFDTTTNTDLGTITLSEGVAELTTSSLSIGLHAIQASYSGDSIFQPSVGLIMQGVQYEFSGYLPPLDKNLAFAVDRTVPIKFQLTDYNGNFITSLSAITSLQVLGPSGTISSDTSLSADSGVISLTPSLSDDSSQFIAHWKTKGLAAGTYTISLILDDGTINTLDVQLTTNRKDGGATQMAAGTGGGDNSGLADTLLAGNLNFYINDPNGYFTADELARIQDTLNGLNALLNPQGIAINEVGDSSSANLVLDTGTTSACGGMADGVLGCFNGPAGEVTILQGWNWYAGADPTRINAVQYDFQSTVTHEFGHALGLGGATDPHSPMFETLATGQAHRIMTVADLNLLEPPQGPDPERAALPSWAGIYFAGLGKSGEEIQTSNLQEGHLPAAEHGPGAPLIDQMSASAFYARTADLRNDDRSPFNREAQTTVDEQDEFWSTIAGTVLERITDLTDQFGK
jgi:uncharacterized repeat protein (TIGR01451 family)